MKIFQVENDICFWDATEQFPTLESTIGKFPPEVTFVEAPDYVYEGWLYINGQFIRPSNKSSAKFLDEKGLNLFKRHMDQQYSSGLSFQITIPKNAWQNNQATVLDTRALASQEYVYFTSVVKNNRNEYLFSGVHPEDVTTQGEMSFTSKSTPANNLTIDILRLKVKDNG